MFIICENQSPFYWESPPRHVVQRVEENRAIGIMFQDPEYMVLFECKTNIFQDTKKSLAT